MILATAPSETLKVNRISCISTYARQKKSNVSHILLILLHERIEKKNAIIKYLKSQICDLDTGEKGNH